MSCVFLWSSEGRQCPCLWIDWGFSFLWHTCLCDGIVISPFAHEALSVFSSNAPSSRVVRLPYSLTKYIQNQICTLIMTKITRGLQFCTAPKVGYASYPNNAIPDFSWVGLTQEGRGGTAYGFNICSKSTRGDRRGWSGGEGRREQGRRERKQGKRKRERKKEEVKKKRERNPSQAHLTDPHHLLQTHRSGSLYTPPWETWQWPWCNACSRRVPSARSRTWLSPFLTLHFHTHIYTQTHFFCCGISVCVSVCVCVFTVCCTPFHLVTLRYFKADNLTILPAS